MSCLSPITIKTDSKSAALDYIKDGKVSVPCGRCHSCLSKRRNDWSFRLEQELKVAYSAYFITLTYDDEKIPRNNVGQPTLNKRDVQLFIKRLRKANIKFAQQRSDSNFKRSINPIRNKLRYYACGEYGSNTDRPHYHIIMFNLSPEFIIEDKTGLTQIQNIWKHGYVHIGKCNAATIAYTTKYVLKKSGTVKKGRQGEFSLMSRKPALGANYLCNSTYHQNRKESLVKNSSGRIQRMPRYYKEKIFSKDQLKEITKTTEQKLIELELLEDQRIYELGNQLAPYKLEQLKARIRKQNLQAVEGDVI